MSRGVSINALSPMLFPCGSEGHVKLTMPNVLNRWPRA